MNKTKTKNPRKVKGVIAYHLPKKKKKILTDTNEQQPKKLAFIAFALFIK